uniref:DUF4246 domain-containing protein n=1 Tax=Bionectria ochroleuca TaxID=29856 RepID=A0A8H7K747_BIOOC
MASIEIAANQVEFPAGNWHVEGQMNEHIVGTALYYLDSENVTPSYLDFRMPTSYDQDSLQMKLGQDQHDYVMQVYGTDVIQTTAMQYYGRVETKEGRLLAFPNVFHHRVSDFERVDERPNRAIDDSSPSGWSILKSASSALQMFPPATKLVA